MNEPMDQKRRAKLVRMVEEEMWYELSGEWGAARTPFGYLDRDNDDNANAECGCPSQVRFRGSSSDLLSDDHDALLADKLIPNMDDLDCGGVRAELKANPGAIFDRFEHYQRLVTS